MATKLLKYSGNRSESKQADGNATTQGFKLGKFQKQKAGSNSADGGFTGIGEALANDDYSSHELGKTLILNTKRDVDAVRKEVTNAPKLEEIARGGSKQLAGTWPKKKGVLPPVSQSAAAADLVASTTANLLPTPYLNKDVQVYVEASQQKFKKGRLILRDEAFAKFEASMKRVNDNLEEITRSRLKRLRADLAAGTEAIDVVFEKVAKLGTEIRHYTRADVDDVLDRVVDLSSRQRTLIDEFGQKCHALEDDRRVGLDKHLHILIDDVRDFLPNRGEIERAVDAKVQEMNQVFNMNFTALGDLTARLLAAEFEKQKQTKERWRTDVLLLWRRCSHQRAVAEVLRRVEGDRKLEMLRPPSFVDLLEKLQTIQKELWEARSGLALGTLGKAMGEVKSGEIKVLIEDLHHVNEKFQDRIDETFKSMKVVSDEIRADAHQMTEELTAQLVELDARQEWHGHPSVEALLSTELQPKIEKNFKFVEGLMMRCSQDLQHLDDAQQTATVNLLQWAAKVAEGFEKFKSTAFDYQEMEVEGTWSDLLFDHEEEKKENEDELSRIKDDLFQAVDIDELDKLYDHGMSHLDVMVDSFQHFYENQVEIIKTLPLQTEEFFLLKLEPFLESFGLASVHKSSNWKPKHQIEEVTEEAVQKAPDAPEGEEVPQEETQEEEKTPKKEKPVEEPKLDGIVAWAGIFEVTGCRDEEANGAYVHYQASKTKKRSSVQKKPTGKDSLLAETKMPDVYINVTRPHFEIKFKKKEGWALYKTKGEGEKLLFQGPTDVAAAGPTDKPLAPGEIREVEDTNDKKRTSKIAGTKEKIAGTKETTTSISRKESKLDTSGLVGPRGGSKLASRYGFLGSKEGAQQAEALEEKVAMRPTVRGQWEHGDDRASVVWRPSCEDELGSEAWRIGTLFTDKSIEELVDSFLHPPVQVEEAVEGGEDGEEEPVEDIPIEDPVDDGQGEEIEGEKTRVPMDADGRPCLLELEYDSEEVKRLVGTLAKDTMSFVAQRHATLTSVIQEKTTERSAHAESTLFDQRRKDVGRRGIIRVEWYAPRKAVIERHIEAFQKFLHGTAIQVEELQQAFQHIQTRFEDAIKTHDDDLVDLRAEFPKAASIAQFLKLEREGEMSKITLLGQRKEAEDAVLRLASREIGQIKEKCKFFLARCHVPSEQYSKPELVIYKREMNTLTTQLTQIAKVWQVWSGELMKRELGDALAQFGVELQTAQENLSEEKGLGRKHGEVRRAMLQQVQTLTGYTVSAMDNIRALVTWCAHMRGAVPESVDKTVCARVQAAFRSHPPESGSNWTLVLEVRAVLSIIGIAVRLVGKYLDAWKAEHEQKFVVGSQPTICFVRENLALCSGDTEGYDVLSKTESQIKQKVVIDLFGRLRMLDPLSSEFKTVREGVGTHYKGVVPKFMEPYMVHATEVEHMHLKEMRQQLEDLSSSIRGDILADVAKRAFVDLAKRCLQGLQSKCTKEEEQIHSILHETDEVRRKLDMELGPEFANPNKAERFAELCAEEKERRQKAFAALKTVRIALGDTFRSEAQIFLKALVAQFEAMVGLVDALPLPMHFTGFTKPDEEDNGENGKPAQQKQDGEKRDSMKRVMRRAAGARVTEPGTLPPRVWEGLPLDQLVVDVNVWPEKEPEKPKDPVEEEIADPKAKAKAKLGKQKSMKGKGEEEEVEAPKVSPAVHSYRSPLHKALFKGRAECYQWYSKRFLEFMAERHKTWTGYDIKQNDLMKSWKQNVKQLRVFTDDPDSDEEEELRKKQEAEEEERRRKEEEQASLPPIDAKGKAKAKAKGKG